MTHPALRFGGAVLVAVVAIWAGARVYSVRMAARVHSGSIHVPAGEASVPTQSDLDADLAAVPAALKIPEHLPSFSLQDRDGKPTSIDVWQGKSLIINFWATWCAPCRREIPLLETLHRDWQARGIVVVGIAVDYRAKVLAFADEFKIPYPLLIGEQDALDAAAALGVASPGFPFTVFTDSRGEVVALFLGELHKPQADLILSIVQTLNQNQVALQDARRSITEGLHALAAQRPG